MKACTSFGLGEPHLGLQREGEQALVRPCGPGLHTGDVRTAVAATPTRCSAAYWSWILVNSPGHHGRVYDEPARPGAQDPLDTAAPRPFLDQLDQTGLLQRLQVVVQPLPGQLQFGGEPAGRAGCAQTLALALVRPWGRVIPRGWLRAGSAGASALLVVYGGLSVLLGALVLSGVIHPAASVDRTALWLARRGLGPVVPGVVDLAGGGYRRLFGAGR